MKLHELFSALDRTPRNSIFGIPIPSDYDYRLGPLPQTDVGRKIDKMNAEIERDETRREIYVPLHMRNEYFDDEYEDLLDPQTEDQLLDREVNRMRMMNRGVQPPALPYPSRR